MLEFDLPTCYAMAMRAIEARGANWLHKNDPNRPVEAKDDDCYNAFKVYREPGTTAEAAFHAGCIVGHMLDDAGLATAEWLYENAESTDFEEAIRRLNKRDGREFLGFTSAARQFMRRCQTDQDAGKTWGVAVQRALIVTKELAECDTVFATETEKKWLSEQSV